ncbi:MAG: 5-demethoxyubiquinol-8 5-hydroxylase UbiM [Gammaproteobacteria bacterium]|nr:5-demethoxyubiquinol-8 5-hydroxylase UbiM [Gammaproteobacteria bacterium]
MDYDIIVVGAGPAGLSIARSLADSDLHIGLVEKQSRAHLERPEFDGRDIALTHLSVRLLKEMGVWDRFDEDERPAIRAARVLNGDSPYCLNFDVHEDSIDALGWLVSNHDIRRALFAEVQQFENIEFLTEVAVEGVATNSCSASVRLSDGQTLSSRLIIAADSRFSDTRRMVGIQAEMFDFGRVCIVARMEHEQPHDETAYECFHYQRTLAVLPLSSHASSIVVTAPMSDREELMGMSDTLFARDIQRRFENRYGEMALCTERFPYPLVAVHAKNFCTDRFACVGDSAVGMHPVTAHGYNLGLSGADLLAKEIRSAVRSGGDIGDLQLLKRYERKHMRNTRPMFHGTNEIVKFFTDDRLPAKIARKVALRLVNHIPPIRRVIRNKLTDSSNRTGILPPFFG